jgi:hypothetical protein
MEVKEEEEGADNGHTTCMQASIRREHNKCKRRIVDSGSHSASLFLNV